MRKPIAITVAALLLGLAGCSKKSNQASSSTVPAADAGSTSSGANAGVSSADANGIRAAIEDRLRERQGLNMSAMEMNLDSVSINGDKAQARASFHVKNGATGMIMNYFLQRSGNGWVVTNAQPADGNTTLPPTSSPHPGTDTTQSQPSMPDVNAFFKNHPAPKSN